MEIDEGKNRAKIFNSQAKEVIYNVFHYIKNLFPDDNKTRVKQRVSEATGVSIRSVERIIKEGDAPIAENSRRFSSPKKRQRKSTVTGIPDYEKQDIRNMIYNFHKTENCRVTLKQLQWKLQQEYEWTGSRSSLCKVIKEIGFKFRKTRDNRAILIERDDIRLLRIKYLERIKYYRSLGKPIVFLDETYIHAGHTKSKSWSDNSNKGLFKNISKGSRLIIVHAGGEMGFIPNCLLIFKSGTKSGDYHDEMNSENYEKWLINKLIPNLPPNSVVVTDNAPYHNIQVDKAPTSNSKKADMVAWLDSKNISFSPGLLKPQLYEIIKSHKKGYITYKFDNLLQEHGHVSLRLPPYHPDLNPIENIWAQVKNNVAQKNVHFKLDIVNGLVEAEFDAVTIEDWNKRCQKVIRNENKYLENEHHIDIITDELIININNDSEDDSDDYASSSDEDNL